MPGCRACPVSRRVLVAAIAGLTACSTEGSGDRVTRRDSAGVQIVQNPPADSGATAWWSLSNEPRLDIGKVEGTETEVLFRVVDAVRLADGRVAIASAANAHVRYYSPGGAHLITAGAQGGGPGEFRRITGLLPMLADSIAVIDAGARRVTVLGPDGKFARVVLGAPGAPVTVVGLREDGTWVAQATSSAPNNAVQEGPLRPNVVCVTLPPSGGSVLDTLGAFPGVERVLQVEEDRGRINSVEIFTPPFAKAPSFVTAGNDLIVGTQDAAEVRVFDYQGALRRIIRTGTVPQRVTPELMDVYLQRQLASVPAERQQAVREGQMAILTAEVVPPYGALLVDRAGNLWMQDYPGLTDDQRWTVFDADGSRVARITLPLRFTLYDIGSDWVLGRELDDLDVEHVRLYDIETSARART
jgi:hypothetical protein